MVLLNCNSVTLSGEALRFIVSTAPFLTLLPYGVHFLHAWAEHVEYYNDGVFEGFKGLAFNDSHSTMYLCIY